ncbi:GcrA family cell cycle regulator [Microvirga zambiensis]|uniref:GcrA family cell cycle regulator n=1 Tax=Microvirga zambiensis TaxID=1402137 RepID=UPI00191F42A3
MPEISEPSQRTRTTLFKLRARQCRFIVSDDGSEAIFCGGQAQEGSSWCPWHRRLVYTKPLMAGSGAGKRTT